MRTAHFQSRFSSASRRAEAERGVSVSPAGRHRLLKWRKDRFKARSSALGVTGGVCVAAFMPSDAPDKFHAWRQRNINRYGPISEWEVGLGRAIGGKDFVAVWVPEEHAAQVAD